MQREDSSAPEPRTAASLEGHCQLLSPRNLREALALQAHTTDQRAGKSGLKWLLYA